MCRFPAGIGTFEHVRGYRPANKSVSGALVATRLCASSNFSVGQRCCRQVHGTRKNGPLGSTCDACARNALSRTQK
ncbi:Uncharacterised protein [Mycobacteroides abscessus subsp. abscessus]|nr:Uncharacterised protein [Mycobacteroides abscessus subsp. abscessus]